AADDDAGAAQPVEPVPAAEPRQVERGWIVQVGTFRKSSNAEKLMSDLKSSGFGPSTTDVETSAGPATRVWVGPFETRVEAARVKNRVAQKIGSEPLIVAYP
ncbi:MAG TPA: SPOR domain-containing protein, partial [Arenicellales bacterium]|nr:SPOR domain-containing protein [Arenicellales bacterium]